MNTPRLPLTYPPCIVANLKKKPLLADVESNAPGGDDGRKPPMHSNMPSSQSDCITSGLHVGGVGGGALMVYVMDEMPYLRQQPDNRRKRRRRRRRRR